MIKFWKLLIVTMASINASNCQSSNPNGFDVNLFRNTPVYDVAKAINSQDTLLIEKLVTKDKSILNFQESKFGETLLTFACITDKPSSAKKLLELGASPNTISPYDNSNVLIDVCKYYQSLNFGNEILQSLIKYGANVNFLQVDSSIDQSGKKKNYKATPLRLQCLYGNLEGVQILVENGADLTIYPKDGENSIISSALFAQNLDIVKYFLIEKSFTPPAYCVIRQKGGTFEKKMTIIDLLNEDDYKNDLRNKNLKEEIIAFLTSKNFKP